MKLRLGGILVLMKKPSFAKPELGALQEGWLRWDKSRLKGFDPMSLLTPLFKNVEELNDLEINFEWCGRRSARRLTRPVGLTARQITPREVNNVSHTS